MFLLQLASVTQKQKTPLHLLLVIGIILYVYLPLLDHWLEHEHYARPHTHIHLPEDTFYGKTGRLFLEHQASEESALCLLDIKTLICVLPNVNIVLTLQDVLLNFGLPFYQVYVAAIYLPLLDPPPRSFA